MWGSLWSSGRKVYLSSLGPGFCLHGLLTTSPGLTARIGTPSGGGGNAVLTDEPGLNCCKYLYSRLNTQMPTKTTSSFLCLPPPPELYRHSRAWASPPPLLPLLSSPGAVLYGRKFQRSPGGGGCFCGAPTGMPLKCRNSCSISLALESSASSPGAHGALRAKAGCWAADDAADSSRVCVPRPGRGLSISHLCGGGGAFQPSAAHSTIKICPGIVTSHTNYVVCSVVHGEVSRAVSIMLLIIKLGLPWQTPVSGR